MTPEQKRLSPVEKLDATHDVDSFECGEEPLDRFLKRFALANQKADSARTYVACRGLTVIAYYSLAAGAVEHADAPLRVGKGLVRHPIPVMLLARLAVDLTWQGRGLGKALVKDALLRTAAAADIAGIRALLVHAKDDEARGWYEALEFEPSPTDPYHQLLLMNVRAESDSFTTAHPGRHRPTEPDGPRSTEENALMGTRREEKVLRDAEGKAFIK